MISGRRVVAVVPARKGSKGLPGKNIYPIAGRPLIEWTLRAAGRSKLIDHVVVSTDCSVAADIAARLGFPPPFVRPAELATDEASTVDVVTHVLDFLESRGDDPYDYVMLLEPTAPLRTTEDIEEMIRILDASADYRDGLVSVGRAKQHPNHLWRFTGGELQPYYNELDHNARRQDSPEVYFPYGIAYVAKTDAFLEAQSFYVSRLGGYLIKPHQEVEVDDIYDLRLAEQILIEQGE